MIAIAVYLAAATVDPCAVAAEMHTLFRDRVHDMRVYPRWPRRIERFSVEDHRYLEDVVTPAVDAALASGQCVKELESAISREIGKHDRYGLIRASEVPLLLAYYDQELRLPADEIDDDRERILDHATLLLRAQRYADAADEFEKHLKLEPRGVPAVHSMYLLTVALESLLPRRRLEPISEDTPSVSELPETFESSPLSPAETRYVAAVDRFAGFVTLGSRDEPRVREAGWASCNAAWLFAIRGEREARDRLERIFKQSVDDDVRARAARLLIDFVARTDSASLPDVIKRVSAQTTLIANSDRLRAGLALYSTP